MGADVLKVISRSALDVQKVLDALVESAARLCDAYDAAIFQVVFDRLRLVAHHYRTALAVPLVHAGAAIGVIFIRRSEVRPFTERQVELVNTFADQAVIAIENTRLFEEVQARTRELAKTVEDLEIAISCWAVQKCSRFVGRHRPCRPDRRRGANAYPSKAGAAHWARSIP